MTPKASIFRIDPAAFAGLTKLSTLLRRPMNKLVNEAIRAYLLKTTPAERELEETLASLRNFRAHASRVSDAAPEVPHPSTLKDGSEPAALTAAQAFLRRVSARYPMKSAVLFGSRARGTHRPDSDVDIGVVLCGTREKFMEISLDMADMAFDVLLETGIYIQPLPLWEDEWANPERHSNPRLLRNIQREGVPV
jgi:predicted nucleotidyltransferase